MNHNFLTPLQTPSRFLPLNLIYLLIGLFAYVTDGQVVWNNYPDIKSGQVSVYTASGLIVAMTPALTFNQPFTLSSIVNPVAGAIGISAFEIPETHDFALITNKSITSTVFTFMVRVSDESAFYVLKMNYIVMFDNNNIYRMLSRGIFLLTPEYYTTSINSGIGYRSEYDILSPPIGSDPFFSTTNIQSTLVLEGFRLINNHGTYTFIGVTVNIPAAGKINTTFYTYQQNQIYFIQYTILFYKRSVAYQNMVQLFDVGYANFTFNSTLINLFFSNIETKYTSSAGRMFFGLRQFNFTCLDNKIFEFDLNSFANLSVGYQFSANTLIRIRLSYYFFVKRSCLASTFFYKNLANPSLDQCYSSCTPFTDRPIGNNSTSQCISCHHSCLTCTALNATDCSTCSASMYRHQTGSTCPCNTNYADNGTSLCVQCWILMEGCQTCTSSFACTSCRSGFSGTTSCSCSTGSVVSGYCNSVYGCTSISDITGTPLCTACNQLLYLQLAANFTCVCIYGTTALSDKTCKLNCGDKYVLSVQGCDDGNSINGDGCSSTCKVQKNWACVGSGSQGSTCKISVAPNLQYVGITRISSQNTALMYFTITPYFKQYTYINYTGLLQSNITNNGFQVQFKTDQLFLIATVSYTEDIEQTYQSFILYTNNTKYFWNSSDVANFLLKGVNCELTFDSNLWIHNVLKYVYIAGDVICFIIFGVSIFYEKWIGLQLTQTLQSIFFIFALLKQCPFQFTGIVEGFKYANGFDDIFTTDYFRTYTLSNQLNYLSVEKEFLSNYNVMYIILLLIIAVMITIGLIKRKYRLSLQEQISKKINDKIQRLDRAYSFIFGKIFIMLVFFSMFKIIFCFVVQLNHQYSPNLHFPDQFNVTAGIIAFILVFSTISFVLYWFLLLPNNFSEEQEFMSIKFQNMSFYYPTLYLAYQAIFILVISITYLQDYSPYLVLVIQILYLFALIYLRPYNTLRKLNKLIHNFTIIFNQILAICFVGIVIRWNSIIGTTYQPSSNYELTVYCFIFLVSCIICFALTIIRIAMFNKDVSFKCFKKEEVEDVQAVQNSDYDHMKKMISDDKEKLLKNSIPQSVITSNNNNNGKDRKDSISLKKKQKIEDNFQIDESKIEVFLNEKFIHFNKESLPTDNKPKVTRSKIKSTVSHKKASLIKSPLQAYIEMKKIQKDNKILHQRQYQ